ncbi:unnamed protein product [Dovyalis caffra]|uniref:Uncharacterized protein n=1 Tax=Dovyalis caffra TaxID=77055 RepID=A0AAV1R7R0_9ROSI|nr:unnamed protein product [Dovyalis caffra]
MENKHTKEMFYVKARVKQMRAEPSRQRAIVIKQAKLRSTKPEATTPHLFRRIIERA